MSDVSSQDFFNLIIRLKLWHVRNTKELTMKAVHVHARIDADTKAQAESIMKALGLTPSQAVNLLYRQIIANKGIPFPVKIPNDETIATFRVTDEGRDLFPFETSVSMLASLKADA
jgi:addiction module RelB/DinJ family antitoxin